MGLFVFSAFLYSLGVVYSLGARLFSPLLIDFLFYVTKKEEDYDSMFYGFSRLLRKMQEPNVIFEGYFCFIFCMRFICLHYFMYIVLCL